LVNSLLLIPYIFKRNQGFGNGYFIEGYLKMIFASFLDAFLLEH